MGIDIKKVIISCGMILLLVLSPKPTLAADALYRMLHADEVKGFQKDQDAFLVGQVTQQQENHLTVKVLKVISGRVSSDTLLVSSDFTYGWGQQVTPGLGDYAVFSLKKAGNTYQKAWGIFASTSGDYQTLRLKSSNAPTPGLLADLAAIEWYVNSGGREKDFYFSSSTAFVRRGSGQSVQIYPVPSGGQEEEAYRQAQREIRGYSTPPDQFASEPFGSTAWGYVLLVAALLIGASTLLWLTKRKRS